MTYRSENTYTLNLPKSKSDYEAAILDVFGTADVPGGVVLDEEIYLPIAEAALESGLEYAAETDYGAKWRGTKEQFEHALSLMPEWARPYASGTGEQE